MRVLIICILCFLFSALDVSFADFPLDPKAPIHTMNRKQLEMNVNAVMETAGNLIEKCYDQNGRFKEKNCKPALEEFKIHLQNASENLYCPAC